MGDKSAIEWCSATWNCVVGCSVLSPGCTNCYAMGQAARIQRMNPASHYAGTTQDSKAGPVWTGKLVAAPDHIWTAPLRWKKPRMIFVNSMGDLFHEAVPDEWIDRAFAVMALAPQHTFQCLTKRSSRMRSYCSEPDVTHRIAKAIDAIQVNLEHDPHERWASIPGFEMYQASTNGKIMRDSQVLHPVVNRAYDRPAITLWKNNQPTTYYVHKAVLTAHRGPAPDGLEARHRNGDKHDNRLANLQWATGAMNQRDKVRHGSNGGPSKLTRDEAAEARRLCATGLTQQVVADRFGISRSLVSMIESRAIWADALAWPLPNCWLGVSCEDQRRANERVPDLLATATAVRFVSAEPLLGAIRFNDLAAPTSNCVVDALRGESWEWRAEGVRHNLNRTLPRLDWVIVGGESGQNARPMHPDWARSIRDQCAAAGVAYFFKQWGEFLPWSQFAATDIDDDAEQTRFATFEWDDGHWSDIGRMTYADCIRRAKINIYLARRLNRPLTDPRP